MPRGRGIALLLLLAACGRPAGGEVSVLAASSLAAPFGEIARQVEQARPGTRIRLGFAGSPQVVRQVLDGAPADVVATADEPTMQRLAAAGEIDGAPVVFARNRLSIVVRPGNPARVRGLADLARPGLVVVLAGAAVPAGRYTSEALARAGTTVRPASLEDSVRGVVSKVALGEADAGIAYTTDVRASAGRVEAVEIPPEHNVEATYLIGVLRSSPRRRDAAAFVETVRSERGWAVLAAHGFLEP